MASWCSLSRWLVLNEVFLRWPKSTSSQIRRTGVFHRLLPQGGRRFERFPADFPPRRERPSHLGGLEGVGLVLEGVVTGEDAPFDIGVVDLLTTAESGGWRNVPTRRPGKRSPINLFGAQPPPRRRRTTRRFPRAPLERSRPVQTPVPNAQTLPRPRPCAHLQSDLRRPKRRGGARPQVPVHHLAARPARSPTATDDRSPDQDPRWPDRDRRRPPVRTTGEWSAGRAVAWRGGGSRWPFRSHQ